MARLKTVKESSLDFAATITEQTNGVLWSFADHSLKAGPLDGLRRETEDLAATFDTRQLEPSRKLWEKVHRPVKKP